MIITDKNGMELFKGDEVIMPDPNDTDLHQHSFQGTVLEIQDDDIISVVDQDNDVFDIEANRVEIAE